MSSGLNEEEFCYAKSAPSSFCSSGIVHKRQPLFCHLSLKNFPRVCGQFLRIHHRVQWSKLLGGCSIILTAAVVGASARLARRFVSAHGFRCGVSGKSIHRCLDFAGACFWGLFRRSLLRSVCAVLTLRRRGSLHLRSGCLIRFAIHSVYLYCAVTGRTRMPCVLNRPCSSSSQ